MKMLFEDIKNWLDNNEIKNYNIKNVNNTFVVDVDTSVNLSYRNLNELPFKFGIVKGDFNCSHNKIKTIKNFPYFIEGSLDASHNKIKTVKNLKFVLKNINFSYNEIKFLSAINKQNGDLNFSHNFISKIKLFLCQYQHLNLSYNNLDNNSNINLPFLCDYLNLSHNKLTKYSHFTQCSVLDISNNNIEIVNFYQKDENKNVLISLNISNNKIKKLINLPIIQNNLFAENNQIDEIDKVFYAKSIYLNNNKLKSVDFNYKIYKEFNKSNLSLPEQINFSYYLNVSNNELETFKVNGDKSYLISIDVNCQKNNLSDFDEIKISNLKPKEINLSENKFKTFKNYKLNGNVDLSHNNIDLESEQNECLLPIYNVNLSNNKIKSINNMTIELGGHVDLSDNEITDVNLSKFSCYDINFRNNKIENLNDIKLNFSKDIVLNFNNNDIKFTNLSPFKNIKTIYLNGKVYNKKLGELNFSDKIDKIFINNKIRDKLEIKEKNKLNKI